MPCCGRLPKIWGYTTYMELSQVNDAINRIVAEIAEQKPAMIDLIGDQLRRTLDVEDPSSDPAVYGLLYMEVSPEQEQRREQYGFFAPFFEFPEGVYPKPVAATTEEEYGKWKALAEIVTEPHSKARYADLLVERMPSGRERYEYAKTAIAAYREFANSSWPNDLDRKDALTRAYELARMFKDTAVIEVVLAEMLAMAKAHLEGDDAAPGVCMPLLELLAEAQPTDTTEITRLNDIAIKKFADNAFAIDSAHHVQELLTSAGKRPDLYRAQAQYFYDRAMKLPDGFQKLYELHKVEAFAELHGLRDITASAISAAEAIPFESLGMQEQSYSFEIPDDQSAAFAESIAGNNGLQTAFTRLGFTKAVQPYEESKAQAEKQAADHPMLMLFNSFNMGEANSIINSPESQEETLDDSIVENERLQIMISSVFTMHALDEIIKRYKPDQDAIAAAFESELIDANEAKAIARGMMHYVNGDADSAVKCLTPIAERLIRQAARSVGIPTTKLPNPKRRQPGGVKGLGEILAAMAGFLTDEDLRRFWRNSLVDTGGHNIRNRSGHGLTLEFDKPDAATVIHVLCTILILTAQKKDDANTD
jgi:hypothetical protein